MGIDTARFSGDIDEDLLCSICTFVLEDPVQAPICEHVFCNTCITEWLTSSQTCPIDRTNLTIDALKPAPRILRNFLSRLTLSCSNQTHGCPASLTLERFAAHLRECTFNPKRPVNCQSGCGMTILFEEHGNHNCIQSLKIELAIVQKENKEKNKEQEEKISKMQSELDLLKAEIDALKKVNQEKKPTSSDLQLLPTVGQSQAVNQGTVFADSIWLTKFNTVQNVQELFNSLVVPQPSDRVLKRVKEQLSGLGCPLEMVKTLIENSNESRWPPGLRFPEARRAHWDRLKDYRCRVTLFQFMPDTIKMIIIMASDNAHMDQDLFVINPGFLVLSMVHIYNSSWTDQTVGQIKQFLV
ncbi:E3 ubiquitin-protein ligase NRDP1-like isoform X1 [Artemia franciscana]|uniref:E3 ubiquitin-protein ligase NRDP1-like isoform X1 n=1 Tax=Artemia franciscana TaxID=6661 RepID=UPI0032DB3C17